MITGISVTSTGVNDTTDLTQVGQSKDFTGLATVTIGAGTGAQTLLSGSISTSGNQAYASGVTLEGNGDLISTGGNLAFDATVDGGFQLVLSANTTTFGGAVGGTAAIASLASNAKTTDLNGGSVHTSGVQNYSQAVVLTADTTLTSDTGSLNFFSTVDSAVNGPFSLTANASLAVLFIGPVGQATPLASLTTAGAGTTTIDVSVATTGNQVYQQAVLLGGNVTITTQGGNVTFAETVDAVSNEGQVGKPAALTVNSTGSGTAASAGQTLFAGDVGAKVALTTLSVTTGGPFTLSHHVITTGNVLIAVVASPPSPGDSLTIASGGSISTKGAIELRAGGDLDINAGSNLSAASVTLRGDFNNTAAQNAILLAGNIQSPTIAVFVGDGNGTVNVAKTLANTSTIINGGAGTDTYNLSSAAPASGGVLSTVAGAITINGGTGSNTLVLGDAGDATGLAGT
ncbi:MAG: beta strand repeat-containing protein, partial [Pirellulales bacterium]